MQKILESALLGEIYGQIWHNPDAIELKTIMDYLGDYVKDLAEQKKRLDLSALAVGVADAVHDNFLECEECGEKFLPGEMNDIEKKCIHCKPNYDPEGMPGGWNDKQIEKGWN